MRIRPFARLIAPIALVLGLASCGQLGSPVAVLDLNRAVKESGLLAQANNQLAASRQQLQQQLGQLQSQLSNRLAKAKEGLGEKPSTEKQAQFQKELQGANLRLARARKQAAGYLYNLRSRLQTWMRQQVRPVARQVADAKGMKVVLLTSNAVVFDHDTSLDITDQVVGELRRSGTVSAPQAQPPQAQPQQPAQTEPQSSQAEAPAKPAKPAKTK